MCIRPNDTQLFDNLIQPLELNNRDKSLWNDRCDYVDLDHCDNFNINNQNLITLQLNIRSLLSHQSELKELLHKLDQKNSSIVVLCETFLTDGTYKLVNIPGYSLITSNHKNTKGGGTAILLNKKTNFIRRTDLEEFQECQLEMTYIEIKSKVHKSLVVGSLY